MNAFLFEQMVRRELRARYKGSALGVLWYVIPTLVLLAVYAVMFRYLLEAVAIPDYPVFLFVGLQIYMYTSTLSSMTKSLAKARLWVHILLPPFGMLSSA